LCSYFLFPASLLLLLLFPASSSFIITISFISLFSLFSFSLQQEGESITPSASPLLKHSQPESDYPFVQLILSLSQTAAAVSSLMHNFCPALSDCELLAIMWLHLTINVRLMLTYTKQSSPPLLTQFSSRVVTPCASYSCEHPYTRVPSFHHLVLHHLLQLKPDDTDLLSRSTCGRFVRDEILTDVVQCLTIWKESSSKMQLLWTLWYREQRRWWNEVFTNQW
jgi:hypothetical protein